MDLQVGVIGCGAVGGLCAGLMQEYCPGISTTWFVRETSGVKKAIVDSGEAVFLTTVSNSQFSILAKDIVFESNMDRLLEMDIIIVALKTTENSKVVAYLSSALDSCKNHDKFRLVYCFQNGVENADDLRKALLNKIRLKNSLHTQLVKSRMEFLDCTVGYNVVLAGNSFKLTTSNPLLLEKSSSVDHDAEILFSKFSTSFLGKRQSGFYDVEFKSSDEMSSIKWSKLLINLSNPVNALSGRNILPMMRNREYRLVIAEAMREAARVCKRKNIKLVRVGVHPRLMMAFARFPNFIYNTILPFIVHIDEDAKFSMHVDLIAGRQTEIDDLNGKVVSEGEKRHLSCPVNRKLVELTKEAEKAGHSPNIGPKELAKLCNVEVSVSSSPFWLVTSIGVVIALCAFGVSRFM
tara:strand:- start:57 stop:1277 length:1221 start_codon:yes stop_codon:yes gene_type:complete